ncbi:hypothetical protein Drose_01570 [Dactylosporangium roseum]|uniref:DUF1444 family protein n=1 Tax=Dactylosporangium roseum TaxID=47989 RepID=A0ABY5Z6C8_9ACTN|nr:hypothetical protein [Dactylosporangium roseum]UWZ37042.1 hypothetical protein Drose_01570 [Dactylosporangium roseum]
MESVAGLSQWAAAKFGRYADVVTQLAPQAIAAAVARQIDAHEASGLRTRHAYGGAWPVQYEELVRQLGRQEGVEVVRPRGSAVHMVLVNGCLLVPFRYADNLATNVTDPRVASKLSKTCRELLGQFGPQLETEQPTLSDGLFPLPASVVEPSEPRLLGDAEPDAIVLVVFAANEQAGLLRVGFAEAALHDSGDVQWQHIEWLPLPTTPSEAEFGRPLLAAGPLRPTAAGTRFDDAPLPEPIVNPRTAQERLTRPTGEQEGGTPPRTNDDRR